MSLAKFPPVLLISSGESFSRVNVGAEGGGVGRPKSCSVGIDERGGEAVFVDLGVSRELMLDGGRGGGPGREELKRTVLAVT